MTSDAKGHFLNNLQCFSPDGKWLVYDTRNDDAHIARTGSIEMVNVQTGEIKLLYHTQNQTEFGPGVGAAAFSPVTNRVIFIHGIRNANEGNPYSFTRRTGVAVDTDQPGQAIFMDARDITEPFTAGALRGGTHAHSWSGDGKWLSFTYNDYVVEQLHKIDPKIQDLRTVGVMFPAKVGVRADNDRESDASGESGENNGGEMFSIVITDVTEDPVAGSNEIDKAFDECWIGTDGYLNASNIRVHKAIAFQGNVKDREGKTKTELFVVDLPEELITALPGQPFIESKSGRIAVSSGIKQRRITFTNDGVQGPRHWLRSNPDGTQIAFLSKDQSGFINIFFVSPNGGEVRQLTSYQFNIQSGLNYSPDGKHIAYVAQNAIYLTECATGKCYKLTDSLADTEKPTGSINWSPDGQQLAYNRYVKNEDGNHLQIFLMEIKDIVITSL